MLFICKDRVEKTYEKYTDRKVSSRLRADPPRKWINPFTARWSVVPP